MESFREWLDIDKFVSKYAGRKDSVQFCSDPLENEHHQHLDKYEFIKAREQLARAISLYTGVEYYPRPGFYISLGEGDDRSQLREKLKKIYRSLELYETLEQSDEFKVIAEDLEKKIRDIRTKAQTELSTLVNSAVSE